MYLWCCSVSEIWCWREGSKPGPFASDRWQNHFVSFCAVSRQHKLECPWLLLQSIVHAPHILLVTWSLKERSREPAQLKLAVLISRLRVWILAGFKQNAFQDRDGPGISFARPYGWIRSPGLGLRYDSIRWSNPISVFGEPRVRLVNNEKFANELLKQKKKPSKTMLLKQGPRRRPPMHDDHYWGGHLCHGVRIAT